MVRASPCSSCPYLRSTPVGIWDMKEYEKLKKADAAPHGMGATFGCHKGDGTLCRGWVADQKRRDVPSVLLRASLCASPDVEKLFDAVDEKNPDLYSTLDEMCEANRDQYFPEDSPKARVVRAQLKKRQNQ